MFPRFSKEPKTDMSVLSYRVQRAKSLAESFAIGADRVPLILYRCYNQ